MPLETAKDIMLPLDEYAVVDEDATMLDALHALDDAQARIPGTQHPHRAVLVRNAAGAIVGKLGHHAFLAGLEPRYSEVGKAPSRALSRAALPKDFLSSMMRQMSLWQDNFDVYVRRAMRARVGDVMHPLANEQIDIDAPIGEAIHQLIADQTLSLLVTDGGQPVGILRLSDLFSLVAKLIKRRSTDIVDTMH